jgi:hypothetical protein
MEDETTSSEPLLGALEAQNGTHNGNGFYTDEADILLVIISAHHEPEHQPLPLRWDFMEAT